MWKPSINREQLHFQLEANQVLPKTFLTSIFNIAFLQQLEQVAQTKCDIHPSSIVAV